MPICSYGCKFGGPSEAVHNHEVEVHGKRNSNKRTVNDAMRPIVLPIMGNKTDSYFIEQSNDAIVRKSKGRSLRGTKDAKVSRVNGVTVITRKK